MDRNRLEEARKRAQIISHRIRLRVDEAVRAKILAFSGDLTGRPEQYGIDLVAWRYVEENGIKRRLVFAHPNMLRTHPDTSLHYRGIATLSLKRVQQIAGSVDRWEKAPDRVRVTEERALRVARLYNTVISSIIRESTDWTLQNGYRNILATMGITEDGALRNIIGQEAETAVKDKIINWLESHSGKACSADETRTRWVLGDDENLRMIFGSEPDIRFERKSPNDDWDTVATIEVKGGTDPAGALERLGAVKKSFDRTPVRSKNFLVVGVVTNEMRYQLEQMHVERVFDLSEILYLGDKWQQFINEVFHHTLRLLDKPFQIV